ncbi:MAG TPA: hypothetical protein VHS80_17590 [Chthoniobacterales bacterium]|nr:hypothetical protein [Chthoniobacterales bacterium]
MATALSGQPDQSLRWITLVGNVAGTKRTVAATEENVSAAWREKTQLCLANPQCTNWRAVSFTDHRSPITDYWFARAAPTLAKS